MFELLEKVNARPRALERELTQCGFAVDGLYADVAGTAHDPGATQMAVVATRPAGEEGDRP
jgi:hypothetical protein